MDQFLSRWNFVRSETVELLKALTDEDLFFQPKGTAWQPMYYQFGCIARTQVVYTRALKTGVMDFSLFSSSEFPNKNDNKSVNEILALLKQANNEWIEAIGVNSDGVLWPGGKKSKEIHIMSLGEHERIHHGQLISYFTIADLALPPNFKSNWAL
ncbi:DinB family protein [Candidatus Saccharibacteria bacterium]|nr:DinB family protein [Candidatus Saccharibacteria bacterium]